MRKENVLVVVLALCIVAGGALYFWQGQNQSVQPAHAGDSETITAKAVNGIDWQSYTSGLAQAEESDKPVFLYFHAEWCTYCGQLKETTFKDDRVQAYLAENFISISVDTDQQQSIAGAWGVRGLPTLWFLEPDSKKISSLPGYVGPDQFYLILKFIKTRSYEKMTFQEFVQKG